MLRRMTRRWFYVFAAPSLAALLATMPPPGQAASPKKEPTAQPGDGATAKTRSLGTAGPWSAYAAGDKASPICYLVGKPQKSDSAGHGRREPVAMVTHRPSENITNVVSFVEGYPLKSGSDVALEIDDKKFELFTNDDSAWARTPELDRTIVSALLKGRTATVKGTPNTGKPTIDTYSLAGFAKALALIDEACGISRPELAAAPAAAPPAKAPVVTPTKAASAKAAATSKKKTGARRVSPKKVWKNIARKKKAQQATQ
jgi:hypothetical protein